MYDTYRAARPQAPGAAARALLRIEAAQASVQASQCLADPRVPSHAWPLQAEVTLAIVVAWPLQAEVTLAIVVAEVKAPPSNRVYRT